MYATVDVFYGIGRRNVEKDRWCELSSRLAILYFELVLICRVMFAYARFVMFQYSLNQPYKKATAYVSAMIFIIVVVIIWSHVTLDYYLDVQNHICLIRFKYYPIWTKVTFLIWIIWDAVSFRLYYKPLKETDGLSAESLDGWEYLLSTTIAQQYELDDGDWHLSESPTLDRRKSSCQISKNATDLISKFHSSVRRNFWAGVKIILAGSLQFLLFLLFNGTDLNFLGIIRIPTTAKNWYFRSGLGGSICRILGLTQYICMILSEDNWRRAFIPFIFWNRKSWDT